MLSMNKLYLSTILLILSLASVHAFAPYLTSSGPNTLLQATKGSSGPNQADFEYQELKALFGAMQKENLSSNQLPPDKKIELEGYVRRIVNRRTKGTVPLYEMGERMPGTSWDMIFTTQSLSSDLPAGAKVSLEFKEDGKTLDYCLNFAKTLGLSKLTATSSYTVDVSIVSYCHWHSSFCF